MDSKTMCSMGTYLGFILAFEMMGFLFPLFSWPFLILSWMVSAVYLRLMPLNDWVKARVIVEATKINIYFRSVTDLAAFIATIQTFKERVLVKFVMDNISIFPHAQAEQIVSQLEEAIRFSREITNPVAWYAPIIAFMITYITIFVIYIYLNRIGFFRRLIV